MSPDPVGGRHNEADLVSINTKGIMIMRGGGIIYIYIKHRNKQYENLHMQYTVICSTEKIIFFFFEDF